MTTSATKSWLQTLPQREHLFIIAGLVGVMSLYLFFIYVPGMSAQAQLRAEIAAAEQMLSGVPAMTGELQQLSRDLDNRRAELELLAAGCPPHAGLHEVIEDVSRLARSAGLQITRLEPLPAVRHASYETSSLKVSFSGPFRNFLKFVHRLEERPRIFAIQNLSLQKRTGKDGAILQGEVNLAVFASLVESAEFSEKRDSAGRLVSDKERR